MKTRMVEKPYSVGDPPHDNEFGLLRHKNTDGYPCRLKGEIDAVYDMIWLDNPCKYPYLREGWYMCCSPNYRGGPKGSDQICVGLSRPKIRGDDMGMYTGLMYTIRDTDKGMPNEKKGPYSDSPLRPCEAMTIVEHLPMEATL